MGVNVSEPALPLTVGAAAGVAMPGVGTARLGGGMTPPGLIAAGSAFVKQAGGVAGAVNAGWGKPKIPRAGGSVTDCAGRSIRSPEGSSAGHRVCAQPHIAQRATANVKAKACADLLDRFMIFRALDRLESETHRMMADARYRRRAACAYYDTMKM